MEQFALYFVIKGLLKDWGINLQTSFNDVDLNGRKVCGIYVRGGTPSSRRELRTGKYYNYSVRVQLLMIGDLDNESLIELLGAASKARDNLVVQNNTKHVVSGKFRFNSDGSLMYVGSEVELAEDIEVWLSKVSMLSEVSFSGKTTQGVPKYSLNFKVNFGLGGKV